MSELWEQIISPPSEAYLRIEPRAKPHIDEFKLVKSIWPYANGLYEFPIWSKRNRTILRSPDEYIGPTPYNFYDFWFINHGGPKQRQKLAVLVPQYDLHLQRETTRSDALIVLLSMVLETKSMENLVAATGIGRRVLDAFPMQGALGLMGLAYVPTNSDWRHYTLRGIIRENFHTTRK